MFNHTFTRPIAAALVAFAFLFTPLAAGAQDAPKKTAEMDKTEKKMKKAANKARGEQAKRTKAQQALLSRAEALFEAEGMKSGTIIVLAKDLKKKKSKGSKISGVEGFRKIGQRRLVRSDLEGAQRVAVFQKSPNGSVIAYHANAIKPAVQGKKEGRGKGKGKSKDKDKDNEDDATSDDSALSPQGGAIAEPEEQVVVEEIVVEVDEATVVVSEEIDTGSSGPVGEGPCATFGYCPEPNSNDGATEINIVTNDIVVTEIEMEDSESLLAYSKEQPTPWMEVEVQGQKGCGTGSAESESWFATLGSTEGECSESFEYKPAYRVDTTSCPNAYPKTSDFDVAFRHGTSQNCYSCPNGYSRSLNPDIKANDACVKTKKATTSKTSAEKLGKVHVDKPHKKAFQDLNKWWRCPDNRPRRTAYKVTDSKACATEKVIGEKLAKAIDLGPIKNKKPSGAFEDPRNGGEYWKCPSGYSRSASSVTAKDACVKTEKASTLKEKATLRGEALGRCQPGSFLNTQSGHCYRCPAGYRQTASVSKDSAKDPKACVAVE